MRLLHLPVQGVDQGVQISTTSSNWVMGAAASKYVKLTFGMDLAQGTATVGQSDDLEFVNPFTHFSGQPASPASERLAASPSLGTQPTRLDNKA